MAVFTVAVLSFVATLLIPAIAPLWVLLAVLVLVDAVLLTQRPHRSSRSRR